MSDSIKASELCAGFEHTPVLSAATFEIVPGGITVVGGPNGVGKSTLVKTLARQLKPIEGTVQLKGRDIWSLTTMEFAQRVAYVPQSLDPAQDLTVEEMVAMGRNPHQKWWQWYGSQSDKEAVEEALAQTELLQHGRRYYSQLSGGERQRVLIATALCQKPEFMLLDEPTAHLDFRHQLELCDLLQRLKQQSIGILLVLHDLNLMYRLGDQIVLLKPEEGGPSRVEAVGRRDAVLTEAALRRVFGIETLMLDVGDRGRFYAPLSPSGS